MRQTTQKEIFTVGEHASTLNLLQKYLKVTKGCMSLFDFPLHRKFMAASNEGEDYDLRKIFDDTLVKEAPVHSVTFIDNHDSQPLRQFESSIKDWFKPHAYALILLREQGYPCIFYPDLYGTKYKDKGKDRKEVEVEMKPVAELEKLMIARKDHAYGTQRDYFDHPNLIGWIREGMEEKPASGCAVLITNKDGGEKEMEIGKLHAGKTFKDITGNRTDKISVNEEGKGVFKVNAGSISVWVREE